MLLRIHLELKRKNLSNFWKTLEKPVINCKIYFDLNWSEKCVIVATDVAYQGVFSITATK